MERREKRRARTYRAAVRAQRTYFDHVEPRFRHRASAHYFAKRKPLGCDCRKRRHGAPKVCAGLCDDWGYRPAVMERIRWREERRQLLAGADAEGFPYGGSARRGWRARVYRW